MVLLMDEPLAYRRPEKRWHRYRTALYETEQSVPGIGATLCGIGMARMTERTPVSRVPTADRCRTCWRIPKENP